MGLLSLIGIGAAMATMVKHSENKAKKAYPKLNYKEFDAKCARYGIRGPLGFSEQHILKIAARNGVKPNNAGILPEEGWVKCVFYVEKYANGSRDVEDFKRAWHRTVENQIKNGREELEKQEKEEKPEWYWRAKDSLERMGYWRNDHAE